MDASRTNVVVTMMYFAIFVHFAFWTGALFLGSALTTSAQETLRGIALIVGNGEYQALSSLPNPKNDAKDIEALLDSLGFETVLASDRDAKRLARDLENFLDDARLADVALFYYAGHGIQADGKNFIVPVDANPDDPDETVEKLIPLNAFLRRLRRTVRVAIVLLDACRTNPFPPEFRLPLDPGRPPVIVASAGLSGPDMTSSRGAVGEDDEDEASASIRTENEATMIGFAAEPGLPALDGVAGTNSPYAAAILRHVGAMPGESLSTVMSMISEEVYLKTNGRQRPWVNQSLRRKLFFGSTEVLDEDRVSLVAERRQLLVHIADLPMGRREVVHRLADQGGVPMDVVFAMMRAAGIGEEAAPLTIEARLRTEIERFAETRANRDTGEIANSEIRELTRLADEAELEGALVTANRHREAAKALERATRSTLEQQTEALTNRWRARAAIYANSAATKNLLFDFAAAARDFAEAFEIILPWDTKTAFHYLEEHLDSLLNAYKNKYDPTALASLMDVVEREILTPSAVWSDAQRAVFHNFAGHAETARFEALPSRDHYQKANESYEAALALSGDSDDRFVGLMWGNLGLLAARKGYSAYNGWEKLAELRRAIDYFETGIALFDPGGDFSDAIAEMNAAEAFFLPDLTKTLQSQTSAILQDLIQAHGEKTLYDYARFQHALGLAFAELDHYPGGQVKERDAIVGLSFAILGYQALGEFGAAAMALQSRGDIYFQHADHRKFGSALLAFEDYRVGLADIVPTSHPVIYLRLVASLSLLVGSHGENLTEAHINEEIGFAEIWRTASDQLAADGAIFSFEKQMGELVFWRAQRLNDIALFEDAFDWFERFETRSAGRPLDQAEAQFNKGMVSLNVGTIRGEAGPLEAAIEHYKRSSEIHAETGDLDRSITMLKEQGGAQARLAFMTQKRVDTLAAIKTLRSVLTHWTPEKNGQDWYLAKLTLSNLMSDVAAQNQDLAASKAAKENLEALLSYASQELTQTDVAIQSYSLANILVRINQLERNDADLQRAMELVETARQIFDAEGRRDFLAYAHITSCEALADRAALERDRDMAQKAQEFCRKAFKYLAFGSDNYGKTLLSSALGRVDGVLNALPQ